jgi:hypothetical protein
VPAADDLHPDLARSLPLSYAAEIRRAISAHSENGVAALAAFALKDQGAAFPGILICRMRGMIGWIGDRKSNA